MGGYSHDQEGFFPVQDCTAHSSRQGEAEVLTAEQGKPLFESRLEIEGSAENFEYYAEYARRIQGDVLPSDNAGQSIMILKLPLGVVASITPWNFPSAMAARKIA